MKGLVRLAILGGLLSLITHAEASSCLGPITQNEKRIVADGTFLLSTKDGYAYVSSYIPAGTVVFIKGAKEIKFFKRKDMPPIPQCYFEIKTSLGKTGYVLQPETVAADNFPGKHLFPRTQIEIYKKPNKQKIENYRKTSLNKKEVFMSSTYPKAKEKLRVIGTDNEQDFYIVEANFLGENIKGYVYADDIEKGWGVIIDLNNLQLFDRYSSGSDLDIKSTLKTLLGEKVYEELDKKLSEYTQNISLEICKIPITVTPYAEAKVDAWWISGGVKAEGKISIKTANRSYAYETYEIQQNSSKREIEIIKHIECDSEDMLYPLMVKVKYNDEILSLPRDNFSLLGRLLRKKSDARNKDQYKKILTIRSYGDWLMAYSHVDSVFSDWKSAYGDTYSVLLDILVDSISYYPPSKKRVVVN